MDDTDFRILAGLLRDPLASYAELAREVGLTAPAARARVRRLEEAGVLTGFQGLPAAQVFGRTPRIFPFPEPGIEAEELGTVVNLDSVVWASLKHDGSLTVELYLPEETKGPPKELVALLGSPLGSYGSSLPAPRTENPVLSPLDWRLLEVLVPEPRTPVAALAEATGLTRKTVRHRRDRLIQEGFLAIVPIVVGAPSPGLLMFHLALYGVGVEDRSEVLRTLPQKVLVNETRGDNPMLFLLCRADSLSEVLDLERRLREMEAVDNVQVTLNMEVAVASDRLLAWIREARGQGGGTAPSSRD